MLDNQEEYQPPMKKNAEYYGVNPKLGNLWNNPTHIPEKLKKYMVENDPTISSNFKQRKSFDMEQEQARQDEK